MDRNKLLSIIQKDLHELNEITDELAGKTQISMQEIEFALGKSRIICQEFDYLRELTTESLHPGMEVPRETPSFSKELSKDQAVMEQKYEEDDKGNKAEGNLTESKDVEQDASIPLQTTAEISEDETRKPAAAQKTIAEIFVQEKSLNDTLAAEKTIDHKLSGSPLTKLEAAIGLNDRFQFIRELFNNDTSLFNHTVERIDRMENINEAVMFLNSNFKWKKNETSLKFAQLVKRRFSD